MDPFAPAAQLVIVELALNPDGIAEAPDPAAELAARLGQEYEAQRETALYRLAEQLGWV